MLFSGLVLWPWSENDDFCFNLIPLTKLIVITVP